MSVKIRKLISLNKIDLAKSLCDDHGKYSIDFFNNCVSHHPKWYYIFFNLNLPYLRWDLLYSKFVVLRNCGIDSDIKLNTPSCYISDIYSEIYTITVNAKFLKFGSSTNLNCINIINTPKLITFIDCTTIIYTTPNFNCDTLLFINELPDWDFSKVSCNHVKLGINTKILDTYTSQLPTPVISLKIPYGIDVNMLSKISSLFSCQINYY